MTPAPPNHWRSPYTAALVLLAAGLPASGYLLVPRTHLGGWAAVVFLMLGLAAIVGLATVGRPDGALIDSRNRLSLSRAQMLLWTVLVGSGIFVAGMINVLAGTPDPLRVNIPQSLWGLMAISATSFVGAPLILGARARRQAAPDANAAGNAARLAVNPSTASAGAADLLTGEVTGDAGYVSLGKLQLALMVLVALALYAAALAETLGHAAPIQSLPALDNGLVTLLGVSHAGYLAQKAVPAGMPTRSP